MFDAKRVKDEMVQWIRNYFEKNGEDSKAVVGVSGGKDSSVVAALCVEALGADRVVGVMMPQGYQYDIDIAQALCSHLKIHQRTVNIESIVDEIYNSLDEISLNSIVTNNTPARVRMTVLYAISGQIRGRVANTSNLSEDWIGWATKYGDTAGDFSPLSTLTTTEVLAIGRELKLPNRFIDKIPEDGLTGKSDEDNFGFTYAMLDRYIREGICDDLDVKEKIDKMHNSNLHKISPLPSFVYVVS